MPSIKRTKNPIMDSENSNTPHPVQNSFEKPTQGIPAGDSVGMGPQRVCGRKDSLIALQRSAGNRAVELLMRSSPDRNSPPTEQSSLAKREADISAAMVAAQAGKSSWVAAGMFTLGTSMGVGKLETAARVLAQLSQQSETDLTDALFALVHPELKGARIGTHEDDLKRTWLLLRRKYARPALTMSPAVQPSGPQKDDPKPNAPSQPRKSPEDPATVKPAKSATGVKPMTKDEISEAYQKALNQAQRGGKDEQRNAVASELRRNGISQQEWWSQIKFDASFLNVPIQPSGGSVSGVHIEFAKRLVAAETHLLHYFPGYSKAQIATLVGIRRISGVRPPKAATGSKTQKPSRHCFGLAIDINSDTNPFVGNNKSEEVDRRAPAIISRAMFLLHGVEDFNIKKPVFGAREKANTTDKAERAGQVWDYHHQASTALSDYLQLADGRSAGMLRRLVAERQRAGDSRDLAYWESKIAHDRVWIKKGDLSNHSSPEKGGYMDLGRELVVALVGVGNLDWGGDFNAAKDIMHFQLKGQLKDI